MEKDTTKCSAGSDLTEHCSGCTDLRSEGTHQGCTVEHGHVGCSFTKNSTIEEVIEKDLWKEWTNFNDKHQFLKSPTRMNKIFDFWFEKLSAQKEEIENNIVKMKKTDLDLSPGFSITAEYRLGEIRGWNDAIESIISSITSNKEKK